GAEEESEEIGPRDVSAGEIFSQGDRERFSRGCLRKSFLGLLGSSRSSRPTDCTGSQGGREIFGVGEIDCTVDRLRPCGAQPSRWDTDRGSTIASSSPTPQTSLSPCLPVKSSRSTWSVRSSYPIETTRSSTPKKSLPVSLSPSEISRARRPHGTPAIDAAM